MYLDYWTLCKIFMITWISSIAIQYLYRLFWSPLAKFPGPKIAAASSWYEFWYDVILQGQYIWVTKKLHEQYGPIVRVNPYELHINDPHFYHEIYADGSRRRDKYDKFVDGFDAPGAMATTVEHHVHKQRRNALSSFFSRRSILDLENDLQQKVEHLCMRMEDLKKQGQVVNLSDAYVAFTMDVISEYCFGKCYNFLDAPAFKPRWRKAMMGIMKGTKFISAFPWIPGMIKSMPNFLLRLHRPLWHLLVTQGKTRSYVASILRSDPTIDVPCKPSIFHTLRDDTSLPPSEKSVERLMDEGQLLIGAGSDTTGKTLSIIHFHLLKNSSLLSKVRQELQDLRQQRPVGSLSLNELESLPLLTAVIKEGIRLNFGFTARTPRIATNETLQYKGWEIPPGTPVSMSSVFVHTNEELFPDPWSFKPERWTGSDEDRTNLEKFLVSFGKGSRRCIGINLAYAEIYLALSTVIEKFDMALFGTDIRDVQFEYDWAILQPRLGSEGVRARFVS